MNIEEQYNKYKNILFYSFENKIDNMLLEEMINESFMQLNEYDVRRSTVYTFLYMLVKNKISIGEEGFQYLISQNDYDPTDDNQIKEIRKEIRKQIYNLPVDCYLISIWFFIQKIKIKDIAEILNINISTVKNKIRKSKRIIKKYIETGKTYDELLTIKEEDKLLKKKKNNQ